MWLPLENSFERNHTLASITARGSTKYHNIRGMFGGSAAGVSNPWMSADQAAHALGDGGRGGSVYPPKLFEIGAACWYFAQQLSDQLEAAGKLVPIGITDTAIGGQRIEEYMVNSTELYACSERTGATTPEWNGMLYGKMTLPFVDMTVKGWVWYQASVTRRLARRPARRSPPLPLCRARTTWAGSKAAPRPRSGTRASSGRW